MLIVDTYQFRGAAPVESDALEAAAFIFNNRNALVADLATTSSLRARSVSEQGIAAGFALADGATLDTIWLAAPDANALGFATASIENNLRLGLSVPVIIQLLRSRHIIDARLTEPLIAEAFRQVQVKRLPPPPKPPGPGGPGPGSSNVVLASLVIAGLAAGVGVALVVRRRRAHGFAGLGSAETQQLVPIIERAWGEATEVVQKTSTTLQSLLKEAYPSLRKAQQRLDRVRENVESRFAGIEERFWEAHPDDDDVSLEDTPEYRDMNRLLGELEEDTGLTDIRESEWFGSLQFGVKELRSTVRNLEQRRRKLVKVAA